MSMHAQAAGRPSPERRSGLEWLARSGYAARGLVYVAVGVLALLAALGVGGEATDTKGALGHLLGSTGGHVLLAVIAAGLAGMTVWRLLQAVKDTEEKGTGPKGLVTRGLYLVSAVVHGGLAAWAFSAVLGNGGGGSGGSESATARLMSAPFGVFLVAAVGFVLVGFAVQQARQAWTARFLQRLEARPPWIGRLGRAGYAARAVVYTLIGVFLFQAALTHDPDRAGGLGEALRTLQDRPYGPWLLGAVAAGLLAFGLFSALEAHYRRVEV